MLVAAIKRRFGNSRLGERSLVALLQACASHGSSGLFVAESRVRIRAMIRPELASLLFGDVGVLIIVTTTTQSTRRNSAATHRLLRSLAKKFAKDFLK